MHNIILTDKEAEKLKEGLKNAIIQSFTPEEISFHKEGRNLLKENQELEPKVKASIEYLLKTRENLKELSAFEERSKRELQSLTITQMMLNSEMQEKINLIKESIHARRMCLGGMRRCYIEKRKITNCLLDTIQGKSATVLLMFLFDFELANRQKKLIKFIK